MAEYISMKQVPGGTVTSVDDRILYDINLTNGKIYGCEVSYLGNNMIHINAGYGVIKGGLFEIEDHTEYVDFAESEPTPGQIYLHFDAAAQDKLTIVKETSANAHQLVQNEDANYESGVYEIQICTFTATTTALTDVTETWPTASGAMETLGTMEEVMANTEAGKVADALVTKQLNSNLTANNIPLIFDYHDGKYGYNTNPNRGADSFHPFNSDRFNVFTSDNPEFGNLVKLTETASNPNSTFGITNDCVSITKHSGNGGLFCYFDKKIDVTHYKKVTLSSAYSHSTMSNKSANVGIALSANPTSNLNDYTLSTYEYLSLGSEITIDLSNMSGEYYLNVVALNSHTLYSTTAYMRVWFEAE